jgi:phosphoribosyl 1,2-cyclic phosphodiesterase
MSLRFSVLASGSRGNSALATLDGLGLLVDVGIGPKALDQRLAAAGSSFGRLGGAVITHTHGDHARDDTFRLLARLGVPLFCHQAQEHELARRAGFKALQAARLVRMHDDRPFLALPGLWVEPIELAHSGPTFGFRLQARIPGQRRPAGIGYITDTGHWTDQTADALADVDLLAIEFNHDVPMTIASGRPPHLIARNLGPRGHLSNEQAADLFEAVLRRSGRNGPKHLVQLHLSDHCNRVELALAAARTVLRRCGRRIPVLAAPQTEILKPITLRPRPARVRAVA